MSVLEFILSRSPFEIVDLSEQIASNCLPDNLFSLCLDELDWFRSRDVANHTGGSNFCRDDGDCSKCVYDFLMEELKFYD